MNHSTASTILSGYRKNLGKNCRDLLWLVPAAACFDLLLSVFVFPTALSDTPGLLCLAIDTMRYWTLAGLAVAHVMTLLQSPRRVKILSWFRAPKMFRLAAFVIALLVAAAAFFLLRGIPNRGNFEFDGLLHLYDFLNLMLSLGLAFSVYFILCCSEHILRRSLPRVFHPLLWSKSLPLAIVALSIALAHLVAAPVYAHRICAALGILGLGGALLARLPLRPSCSQSSLMIPSLVTLILLFASWPLSTNRHSRFVLHGHVAIAGAYGVYWRDLTDLDHDGATAWYWGGSDCAPNDSSISPMHKEVPGDGIDQDCRGGDAPLHSRVPRTQFVPTCSSNKPTDILFITVDALRADMINSIQMPFLYGFSKVAHRFERAYAPSGSTFGTTLSMLFGKNLSDLNQSSLFIDEELDLEETITEQLAQKGYKTAVLFPFSGNHFVERGAEPYTDLFVDHAVGPTKSVQIVGSMSRQALDILKKRDTSKPNFIWMHIPDLHAPYLVPAPSSPLSGYEQSALSIDEKIGHLVQKLASNGLLQKMLLIISADHGEQLGQRGREGHGTLFFEEGIQVPLLLMAPQCPKTRHPDPVSLISIPNLINRYASDFSSPASGDVFPVVVEEALLSALGLKRAFISRELKLIVDLQNGGEMAFDLTNDPLEIQNIRPSSEPRLAQFLNKYQDWLNSPLDR